jgi:Berberine and berberine like
LQAVDQFSEGRRYPSAYAKGKSDFVLTPLNDDGITTLINGLLPPEMDGFTVTLYAYGGAIARTPARETAFPYRNALACIEYDVTW